MSFNQKNIAFTLCSNNYLAQANVLKESFLKFNPDFKFYIGLVDEISSEIDYSIFEPAIITPISKIKSLNINELIAKYDIIEFNTCVKPSVFKYIIEENSNAEIIYYIDPDICFYNPIEFVNQILRDKAIVLTPHITSPIISDDFLPSENLFLNYGVYNLGFIGINAKKSSAIKMLNWWEEKTLNLGYNRVLDGLFVDQLWINFVPIYYDDVEVIKSYNFNMAPWNLHERHIVSVNEDNEIILNDNTKLVFYHFSNLSSDRNEISRFYKRFDFIKFPLLKKLYDQYFIEIDKNGYLKLKNIPIHYVLYKAEQLEINTSRFRKFVMKLIKFLDKISSDNK